LAEVANNALIGFVYSAPLAPDILELGNIMITKEYRNQGIGSHLLAAFESEASRTHSAILLSNSSLWPVLHEPKISAVPFYKKAGYEPIFQTEHSAVLIKRLDSTAPSLLS
jgi:GNAT superfamily N-acetyltransferase